jgi:hypothetical protein
VFPANQRFEKMALSPEIGKLVVDGSTTVSAIPFGKITQVLSLAAPHGRQE